MPSSSAEPSSLIPSSADRCGRSEFENIETLCSGAWSSQKERSYLRRHYELFGNHFECHRELVYLSWVHRLSKQMDNRMVYDASAIEQRIVTVLNRFNERM